MQCRTCGTHNRQGRKSSGEFQLRDGREVGLKELAGAHQMFDVKWDEKA
jgi:hypothetical protein